MFKILLIILSLQLPTAAYAQSCDEYDREIGKEISKIFYAMRQLYLRNKLSHLTMDAIMTEIHLTYNNEYRLAFQIAVRNSPSECILIRDMGVAWVKSYEEIIINEVNSRRR